MNPARWFVLVALLLLVAGCKNESPKSAATNDYEIKGTVTAVDPNKPAITLDHEDIPGLMKAMKMEFPVASKQILEGIKAGDDVQGRFKKDGLIITELKKR